MGDQGTILHYDGTAWSRMNRGTTASLWSVYGLRSEAAAAGADQAQTVFAVGSRARVDVDATILQIDDGRWSPMPTSSDGTLYGVWVGAEDNAIAVGGERLSGSTYIATILHFDGSAWSPKPGNAFKQLRAVWGRGPNSAYAVGQEGTIIRYDGTTWSAMTSNTTASLNGVWGSGPDNVYAVGSDGTILQYDGSVWSAMNSNTAALLYGIWGSGPNNIYVVGASGTVLRYDGTQWTPVDTSLPDTAVFSAIDGSGPDNIYATAFIPTIDPSGPNNDKAEASESEEGDQTLISHFDGVEWTQQSVDSRFLNDVWVAGEDEVFVVGSGGTILLGPAAPGTNDNSVYLPLLAK